MTTYVRTLKKMTQPQILASTKKCLPQPQPELAQQLAVASSYPEQFFQHAWRPAALASRDCHSLSHAHLGWQCAWLVLLLC